MIQNVNVILWQLLTTKFYIVFSEDEQQTYEIHCVHCFFVLLVGNPKVLSQKG